MSTPVRLSHRRFGFLLAGALLAISAVGTVATQRLVLGPALAAAVLAALALVVPGLLWPLNRFWVGVVARGIAWVNNRLVLGLVYFGVLSPSALVMRLAGRDRLGMRFDPALPTYFEPVARQSTADTLREVF